MTWRPHPWRQTVECGRRTLAGQEGIAWQCADVSPCLQELGGWALSVVLTQRNRCAPAPPRCRQVDTFALLARVGEVGPRVRRTDYGSDNNAEVPSFRSDAGRTVARGRRQGPARSRTTRASTATAPSRD